MKKIIELWYIQGMQQVIIGYVGTGLLILLGLALLVALILWIREMS